MIKIWLRGGKFIVVQTDINTLRRFVGNVNAEHHNLLIEVKKKYVSRNTTEDSKKGRISSD